MEEPGKLLGEDLPCKQWTMLNHLRTGVGRFSATMKGWSLKDSAMCECGHPEQTVDHMIESCSQLRCQDEVMACLHLCFLLPLSPISYILAPYISPFVYANFVHCYCATNYTKTNIPSEFQTYESDSWKFIFQLYTMPPKQSDLSENSTRMLVVCLL